MAQIVQLHQLTPEQVLASPIPVVDRCGRMWGGPDRRGPNGPDIHQLRKVLAQEHQQHQRHPAQETDMPHTQIGSVIIHSTTGPDHTLPTHPGIIVTTDIDQAIAAQSFGLRALLYAGANYQHAITQVAAASLEF